MQKRIMCLLLCAALALLPALSLAEGTFVMAGFDGEESTHDWTTNRFFERMEETTGVSFTFRQYNAKTEWEAAKNAMFAEGGELPDVLFKAALTTPEMIRYSDSGQLIDLKPLLKENAPNLWALLEANPEWLEAVTLPNGKIAALPGLQEIAPQNAMWINQKWLDALGLDMPTDLDSLRETLIAFRDRDPNGNNKQDEVPMLFLGPWELKFLSHAYGVVVNDYNIYLDDAGETHFWPAEDSFIALVKTLRGFYEEKLLDPNGFMTADTLRRVTDDKQAVTYGMFFAPTPVSLVTYEMSRDYAVLEPLVYEGAQVYRDLVGQVTRGTFAITSACSDPAAMLRWVDVLYTEDGATQAMVGKQGEDYIVDEDGYWNWKGGVESVNTTTLSNLSVYDTGDMPWLFPQGFYNRFAEENVRRVNDELAGLAPFVKKPYPVYSLTQAQSEQVRAIQAELGRYVDESLARFVLGQVELTDENIEAFRQGLRDRGMDEMIRFWSK